MIVKVVVQYYHQFVLLIIYLKKVFQMKVLMHYKYYLYSYRFLFQKDYHLYHQDYNT